MKDYTDKTLEAYNNPEAVEKYIKNTPSELPATVKSFIDDFLALCSQDSLILEIGSGTGRDAEYIQKRGYRIIASDASDVFLAHLHEHTSLEVLRINILQDDLPDGLTAVYVNSVFHHLNTIEIKAVLNKIYEKLPKGGLLVFMTRAGKTDGFITEKIGVARYFKYRTADEMKNLLEDCGYTFLYLKTFTTTVGDFLHCIAKKT